MRRPADRIYCLACHRPIRDTWKERWKHAVKYHPEIVAGKLIPMMFGGAEAAGSAAAERIKSALGVRHD